MIEPEALAAMDKMSAALQVLPGFTLTSEVTTEKVLENGQKLQFGGNVEVALHRPDAFKIIANSDIQHREYYFSKGQFTVLEPRMKYYASASAPETVGLALEKLKTDYGIELPLADLFTWGTDQTMRSRIVSGYVVGPEIIGTRTCDHYAFRQKLVDWQIWIDKGAAGLPCKIVITATDDPSMPQYTALLTWDTAAVPEPANIAFVVPAGAHKIKLAEQSAQASAGDKQ
ncbi:DUF2092 domain-containing protein [Novosphingobium sp. AP12]|uniref:DUF2092 domain-containing protein n=1 Tax=Novosphingobium sp. AP12 TaxID=1144305 RepID=UPI0002F21BC4|nr:DUF2092 domain-containing protein [Novosphingobium sp. AP12]